MARDDLSEAAACAHWSAIAWVSGTETFECVIPRRLIDGALPLTNDRPAAIAELVSRGYWCIHDNGDLEVLEHQGFIQQSLTRVGKKRKTDATAQQNAREKQRAREAASAAESAAESAADGAADDVTDSVIESAPRLPTDLTTRQEVRVVPEQRGTEAKACVNCGKLSTYLVGGYCRADACVAARRGRAS